MTLINNSTLEDFVRYMKAAIAKEKAASHADVSVVAKMLRSAAASDDVAAAKA